MIVNLGKLQEIKESQQFNLNSYMATRVEKRFDKQAN
jgi:hypothetical protein